MYYGKRDRYEMSIKTIHAVTFALSKGVSWIGGCSIQRWWKGLLFVWEASILGSRNMMWEPIKPPRVLKTSVVQVGLKICKIWKSKVNPARSRLALKWSKQLDGSTWLFTKNLEKEILLQKSKYITFPNQIMREHRESTNLSEEIFRENCGHESVQR